MTTNEIRSKFLDYMKSKGHAIIPRANIVPQDDPTTLFTGSGMQPLLPYLLGTEHPEGRRLADSQASFRAEDIDEVGDNRHTTFFEMLGNWSLGDYFKSEQLPWFFEFLTKEVGLDPKKLYVTTFIGDEKLNIPKDTESAEIWQGLFKEAGIEAGVAEIGSEEAGSERGMKENERIFYYDASKNWWSRAGVPANMPAGEPGGPDSEVFYDLGGQHDPAFGEHCHPNCDCGRFLEIGNSVFMQYRKNDDGSFSELPQKNVDFGGGLERIAAAANNDSDVFKIDLLHSLVEKIEELSGKQYRDETVPMRVIADHMRASVFMALDGVTPSNTAQGYVMRRLLRRAIRQGLALGIYQKLAETIGEAVINQYAAGMPELKQDEQRILEVVRAEEAQFRKTLAKGVREIESQVGKTDSEKLGGDFVFRMFDTHGFPPELTLEELEKHGHKLDSKWKAEFDQLMAEQRERSRTATAGMFKGGLADHSAQTKKLHTATHLMYESLKRILGDHVIQRGSNITPERLRFDFSHPQKLTDEEKKAVEGMVNEQISADLKVEWNEYPTDEAFKLGASGAFGDKYGDTVKVYSMGKPGEKPFSLEICGGPHVEHTGELGRFRIQKEESSSSGVRRIKAVLE
jgi:alanyl-tRNA synthetase